MKNKLMRAATILMVLTLMTSCFVGSTFAKYTSEAIGNDTARVAVWSIKAGKQGATTEIAGNPVVAFDLFNTIQDDSLVAGDDVNVKNSANDTQIIAPGTGGSFILAVENESEVTAKYSIELEETTTSGIPLQYSLTGGDGTWKDTLGALDMAGMTNQVLAIDAAEVTHTIYWRWAFDENVVGHHASQSDADDTNLGIDAQTSDVEVTIQATITVEQVD